MPDIQLRDFFLNDDSCSHAINAARSHIAQAVAEVFPDVGVLATLGTRDLQQIRKLLIAFESHARRLMDLTEADPEEQKYIDLACKKHVSDESDVKVDKRSAVTSGHKPWGAYVQAWTWVDNPDTYDDDDTDPEEE